MRTIRQTAAGWRLDDGGHYRDLTRALSGHTEAGGGLVRVIEADRSETTFWWPPQCRPVAPSPVVPAEEDPPLRWRYNSRRYRWESEPLVLVAK